MQQQQHACRPRILKLLKLETTSSQKTSCLTHFLTPRGFVELFHKIPWFCPLLFRFFKIPWFFHAWNLFLWFSRFSELVEILSIVMSIFTNWAWMDTDRQTDSQSDYSAHLRVVQLVFDPRQQNTSPLMCTKFEIWRQSILKVIQAFHTVRIVLYIRCSGPVVECLNKINMLLSTTQPLGQNTRYT